MKEDQELRDDEWRGGEKRGVPHGREGEGAGITHSSAGKERTFWEGLTQKTRSLPKKKRAETYAESGGTRLLRG